MQDKLEIRLPWPLPALKPNSRVHWAKKSKAAQMYRYTCKLASLEVIRNGKRDLQPLRDLVAAGGQIHVSIDFYPPNRRGWDDDNVVSAFKSGRDGLADALGIDDKHFRTHPYLKRDEIVRNGEIRVTISEEGPAA